MICQRFEAERLHLAADTSILCGIHFPTTVEQFKSFPGFAFSNLKTRQRESFTFLLQMQRILIFSGR